MAVILRQLPATAVFNLKSNVFAPRGILVSTTPILLFQGNVDKRLSMWIANDDTTTLYVGGHNQVSSTKGQGNTGWPIWQQTAIFMDDVDHEIWGVSTVAAGISVMLIELVRPDDGGRGINLQAPAVS